MPWTRHKQRGGRHTVQPTRHTRWPPTSNRTSSRTNACATHPPTKVRVAEHFFSAQTHISQRAACPRCLCRAHPTAFPAPSHRTVDLSRPLTTPHYLSLTLTKSRYLSLPLTAAAFCCRPLPLPLPCKADFIGVPRALMLEPEEDDLEVPPHLRRRRQYAPTSPTLALDAPDPDFEDEAFADQGNTAAQFLPSAVSGLGGLAGLAQERASKRPRLEEQAVVATTGAATGPCTWIGCVLLRVIVAPMLPPVSLVTHVPARV